MDEITKSKIRIKLGPIEVEYEGSELCFSSLRAMTKEPPLHE